MAQFNPEGFCLRCSKPKSAHERDSTWEEWDCPRTDAPRVEAPKERDWRCDGCAGKGDNKDCMCGGTGNAVDAVIYLRKRVLRADWALAFYADPENYHAISFLMDRPCGGFADDFSADHGHPDYDRPMPGAKAREVLGTPVPE